MPRTASILPAEPRLWVDRELGDCQFADARLGKWFGVLIEQLSQSIGRTIPLAGADWAATKAAYRFLDSDRVDEADILAGHFAATRDRFAAVDGPMLVLDDTTEFSFTREDVETISLTHKVAQGHKDGRGRQRMHTVCPWATSRCDPFASSTLKP